MNTTVTQQEIGKRIAALRKRKALSQEDLAKLLNISRPSLTQIELGNRNLDAFEFRQLSLVLGFSMDALMAPDFSVYDFSDPDHLEKGSVLEERISVPVLHGNKFKNVLLIYWRNVPANPM